MFANILQQEQTSFGLNTASPLMRGKSHVSQALQLKNPPLSQVLQMCCALTKYLTLHTHTPMHAHIKHTHIRTERFSNMPLNGTTKYGLWFHKSCRWRSYVLPVPATGDKSAPVCAFSTDWSPGNPSSWLKSSKHKETHRHTLIKARAIHSHNLLPLPKLFTFHDMSFNLDPKHATNGWLCFRCNVITRFVSGDLEKVRL